MVLHVGGGNGERRKEEEEEGKKNLGEKWEENKEKNLLCAWKEEKRKKKYLSDVVGKWGREKEFFGKLVRRPSWGESEIK